MASEEKECSKKKKGCILFGPFIHLHSELHKSDSQEKDTCLPATVKKCILSLFKRLAPQWRYGPQTAEDATESMRKVHHNNKEYSYVYDETQFVLSVTHDMSGLPLHSSAEDCIRTTIQLRAPYSIVGPYFLYTPLPEQSLVCLRQRLYFFSDSDVVHNYFRPIQDNVDAKRMLLKSMTPASSAEDIEEDELYRQRIHMVSCRALEYCCVTKAKVQNLYISVPENNTTKMIHLHGEYVRYLKIWKRECFDFFKRYNRIYIYGEVSNGEEFFLETTVGQANGIVWALENNIVKYITENLSEITHEMRILHATNREEIQKYKLSGRKRPRQPLINSYVLRRRQNKKRCSTIGNPFQVTGALTQPPSSPSHQRSRFTVSIADEEAEDSKSTKNAKGAKNWLPLPPHHHHPHHPHISHTQPMVFHFTPQGMYSPAPAPK